MPMAVDFFLKVPGVKGESKDSKHRSEIEVSSYSFDVSNSAAMQHGGGGGAGVVKFNSFHFTAPTSTATPALFRACCEGAHFDSVDFTIRKAGGEQQDYLVFTFKLVFVTYWGQSYGIQSSGAPDALVNWGDADLTAPLPLDHFSFAYGALQIQYKEQQADGTLAGVIKYGWDAKRKTKL
jgi:type VI secretion system secreted protein Hcp